MGNEKTICLNMIVKNESHIIEKTLEHLCSYIKFTYWVICDTGSVDNTIDIISNFFNKKNIDGEIHQHKWQDFGHNRTLALEAAYNKTDYLLIFDADDSIAGNFICPQLTEDRYNLFFGNESFKYIRPLIINNRKKWKFKGILHEFLIPLENINPDVTIDGDYFIISGKEGARSKNKNKYLNDANLLKSRIELLQSTNNDDFEDKDLLARYIFYCANSFKDCNDIHNAILYYKKVFDHDTWIQEKYVSALNIGNLYEKLGDIENALLYWYKAITYDKERREAVAKILRYYYNNGNWFAINCLHENIKNFEIKDISSKLFLVVSDIHENHFYNSIACANILEWMSGYYSCKYLLMKDVHLEMTIFNFKCYAYNIHLDPDHKPFLDKLLTLFKKYYYSKTELVEHLWSITSKNFKAAYDLDNLFQIINTNESSILKSKHKISLKDASNKILIYTGYMNYLWNDTSIKNKALGGSEKAVIYLSRHLPKNYEIYIAGDNLEEEIGNIKYINHKNLQSLLNTEKFHTIIVSRYISFFEQYHNYKCFQLVLSGHDIRFLNYPVNDLTMDNTLRDVIGIVDYVLCLTEWHKNSLIQHHNSIKDANFKIINNGINISDFDSDMLSDVIKIKNKFIWSSSCERGLIILLRLWPRIIEKLPDATLDICSYNDFPRDNSELEMKKIIDNFDSIIHHGKLNTNQLYKLMKQSEYWLYTTTFTETSCISAMEMLNSGVICLYYPEAGLVETIGDYGIPVTHGKEIEALLNLSELRKDEIRIRGKEYALTCSWEKRAQHWCTLLKVKAKEWFFVYPSHFLDYYPQSLVQYFYNLHYIYPDFNISLIGSSEIFLQKTPSKLTLMDTHFYFDDNILNYFPNTEIGIFNSEPLNLPCRLNSILNILRKYSFLQYYDYSKSNISILNDHINIKNPIYLPYKCSNDELKLLINYNNNYKNISKEYDFGIINISQTPTPRRNKVIQFLIKNGLKIKIISGWSDDRDIQFGKCKFILNIHGQVTEDENPLSEHTSNIFEHIRCNRILDAGFYILSETSYNLDTDFINKYSNLKIISYEDFFNLDIINRVLNEIN